MNNMLNGYKTYISATLIVLSGLLFWAGIIDQKALISLVAIFGGTAFASTRNAINKKDDQNGSIPDAIPAAPAAA